MALSSPSVSNVRTDGNDANAGWFTPEYGDTLGGANDRAFNNSPVIIDGTTITASVHSTTTQVNIVGFAVTSALRGNFLRISGGTATAGDYRISATDAANNRITLDASAGTSGQTVTGRIGGAYASLGPACTRALSFCQIWQQSGTYLLTSATNNANAGRFTIPSQVRVVGYGTTYGDGGTAPINRASGISSTTLATIGVGGTLQNVEIDGNSLSSIQGISIGSAQSAATLCIVRNCTNSGIVANNEGMAQLCFVTGCSGGTGAIQVGGGMFYRCVASGNSIPGFDSAGGVGRCVECLSISNTTSSGHGFNTIRTMSLHGCVAWNNGGSGFRETGNPERVRASDCIAVGNAAFGFEFASNVGSVVRRTATFNNASGAYQSTPTDGAGNITLTADPFVNAAGGNFALNTTAGGGALLRQVSFALPGISTTSFPDVGAAQASGGGGFHDPLSTGPLR